MLLFSAALHSSTQAQRSRENEQVNMYVSRHIFVSNHIYIPSSLYRQPSV